MSRPPTMSQLLKRAGLAKRARPARAPGQAGVASKPPSSKRPKRSGKPRDVARDEDEEEEEEGGGEEKEEREPGRKRASNVRASAGGDVMDDRIEALERELEVGSESSSSSSDEEGSSSTQSEDDGGSGEDDENGDNGKRRVRKLVSPLEADKIQPLPAHLLPRPGCGVSKAKKPGKKGPKRPRVATSSQSAPGPSQGLDGAVKELMANYEARSSERVPFYCRVCQFHGNSLDALQKHKEQPLHIEATKKERKISTCSLCKKQFTSPPQLKEHLAGKAHLEKLQAVMSRQGKSVPGQRSGSEYNSDSWGADRGRGRGRDGRGRGRGRINGGRMGRGRGPGRGYDSAR